MKKFDLLDAVAGKPLITRDGKEVTHFDWNNPDDKRCKYQAIIHLLDGTEFLQCFNKKGKTSCPGDTCNDLFIREPLDTLLKDKNPTYSELVDEAVENGRSTIFWQGQLISIL